MDARIEKLADLLVNYSCDIKEKDKILISYEGECCKELVRQIIKKVYAAGGMPYVEIRDSAITREILLGASQEQTEFSAQCQLARMKGMQAILPSVPEATLPSFPMFLRKNLTCTIK